MTTKFTKAAPRRAPAKRKQAYTEELLAAILPPGIVVTAPTPGRVQIQIDVQASPDRFASYGGAEQVASNVTLIHAVLGAMPCTDMDSLWTQGSRVAGALGLLRDLKPADAVEGMICAQAVSMHLLAAEAARRAQHPDQSSEVSSRLRKDAANMARAFIDMLAALDRKRGKVNHQTVRVERVLVTEGGALIGAGSPVPALVQGAAPMALAAVEAGEGAGA